jgi:hypothetical protein
LNNFNCFNPIQYLNTYYSDAPQPDEQQLLSFLVREYKKIKFAHTAIEFGIGPTIHHLLPLVPYVSQIHVADFLDQNLNEVRKWKKSSPDAHNWNEYTKYVLHLEGALDTNGAIAEREIKLKDKIVQFYHGDIKQELPWKWVDAQYPCLLSFYTVEQVGIVNKDEWFDYNRNLLSIVEEGGAVFMSALLNTNFYCIHDNNTGSTKFSVFPVIKKDFEEALPRLGFSKEYTLIEEISIKGQESDGVNGVILISAFKK